ncbi:type II toxin-antitoxin system RelB/DinJ family antitoxin [Rubritalea marina]|uniref:type II toxin-antitoxin system RelB/DinJ family antitoxin n=1 Tax=Rubritalea marina TaxID=361055 RepID=UPI000374931D|nr:type II toxin-antitoxin system RelB/DinJ family antitoxin [Rubritalea marina]
MQDTVVRARVSSALKEDTEKVFDALGLTTTEAIRMFLAQVRLRGGLPFDVVLPSDNQDILRSSDKRQAALDSLYDD